MPINEYGEYVNDPSQGINIEPNSPDASGSTENTNIGTDLGVNTNNQLVSSPGIAKPLAFLFALISICIGSFSYHQINQYRDEVKSLTQNQENLNETLSSISKEKTELNTKLTEENQENTRLNNEIKSLYQLHNYSGELNSSDINNREYSYNLSIEQPSVVNIYLYDISSDVELDIIDSSGNKVKSSTNSGVAADFVNNYNISPGNYSVKVRLYSESSSSSYKLAIYTRPDADNGSTSY